MLPGMDVGVIMTGSAGGVFEASASPPSISKTGSTTGASKTLTTAPVTINATGGAGGYTYSWAALGTTPISVTSPSAATTTFSDNQGPDEYQAATFRCTITDAGGATKTVDVSVTIQLIFIDTGGTL